MIKLTVNIPTLQHFNIPTKFKHVQRFSNKEHLITKRQIMKRISLTILSAILFIAATLSAQAQGNTENRQVSGFNSIGSGGPFEVHVKINGTETLKLTADANIINEIETIVEGGKLKIKFKKPHEWREHTGKIEVYITAKSLSELANAGSGSINVEGNLSGENVRISLSGSGDITSSVKSGQLNASIAGSGSIHISGTANDVKVGIAGSGEMLGKNLKTGSASVNITGSGNAYLAADKTISARIVGSGSVIYSGNATVGDSRTIGSGRITKAD